MKTLVLMSISFLLYGTALAQSPLQQDVDFIRQTIASNHPGLGFSADVAQVERALTALAADTTAAPTQDRAWQRLSTLNPLFSDAHLFIGYPDWRAETAAHLQAGGGLFPLELEIADKQLIVRAALGGATTTLAGARLTAINGVPADSVRVALLQRTHGDTPRFRTNLLSQRWWLYYWKMYGAPPRYRLGLAQGGRRWQAIIAPGTQMPAILQAERDPFNFEIKPDGSARLKAGSFDHQFKERFLALTRTAFEQMRAQHVTALTIDISQNGGGDDDLWLEGLMPYLASQPYRTGSSYTKKSGDGDIQTWRQPQPDQLFKGKVVIVIGPATYSSAVLFANVMQDFRFGCVTGEGDAARRTQSGGIQKFLLPHSGLALWMPRFVLAPPAGTTNRNALLRPSDDCFNNL